MTDIDRFTLRHVTENRQEMKKINKKKMLLTVWRPKVHWMLHTEKNKSKTQNVCCIIIIILYCTIKKGFILPLNIPLIKKKCQNLICPVPPPPPCLFFLHSARKPIKLAWILRTYGTYALTKSSLLWCSCTRPSMNSDKTLSPIGKNKVERNSCEKISLHYYYFFLLYYYSFKIFLHFWLAKIHA